MHQTGKLSSTFGGNGTTARAVDSATRSAHDAIDRLSTAVKPAVDRFASGAHEAVEKFAGTASDAAATIADKASRLKEGPSRMAENCRGYVRDKPLASLVIALGVGLLLSRIFASR